MNASHTTSAHMTNLVTLSELLERLERSAVPVAPEQYRSVVLHLVQEFGDVTPDPALAALLDTHPAAAEVYENLNYQYAGLCRSTLDVALDAEVKARDAIARAMRPSNPGAIDGES
jgi:hypothetical protein